MIFLIRKLIQPNAHEVTLISQKNHRTNFSMRDLFIGLMKSNKVNTFRIFRVTKIGRALGPRRTTGYSWRQYASTS